jgi:LacI family transcriptional regulator
MIVAGRVTIKDVAKEAGVSVKTVSRFINNEPYVSDAIKKRLVEAIDKLGYVVSLPAKRLSSGQSYTIGLIFHNASWHYIQDVQKGVLETAKEHGYNTLMHPCDLACEKDATEILNLVLQRLVDGFIFTPPADNAQSLLDELKQREIPFVRLTPSDRESPLPYVTATDKQGAFEMTKYLIDLGHRRVAYIHGPDEQRAAHDRFLGYTSALFEAGIDVDEQMIEYGDDHYQAGYQAALNLMDLSPAPTAIFCNNDEMAAGVSSAIFNSGLKVPNDISVAGFDDIPLSSQLHPALTTVHQPIYEIAQKATTLLMKMLKSEELEQFGFEFATEIVIRQSTARFRS